MSKYELHRFLSRFSGDQPSHISTDIPLETKNQADRLSVCIQERITTLQSLYPEQAIKLDLPLPQTISSFIHTMDSSNQNLYEKIGSDHVKQSLYRQTPPSMAIYAAALTHAIASREGISSPLQVVDLGSGDGCIGLGFGLFGDDVVGIEKDAALHNQSEHNTQILQKAEGMSGNIQFLLGNYSFSHHLKRNVWVCWPWVQEVTGIHMLFDRYAPSGSLLVLLGMSENILEYLQKRTTKPRSKTLGTKVNWRQASFDDFFEANLEEWAHLGGPPSLHTINYNMCIMQKQMSY